MNNAQRNQESFIKRLKHLPVFLWKRRPRFRPTAWILPAVFLLVLALVADYLRYDAPHIMKDWSEVASFMSSVVTSFALILILIEFRNLQRAPDIKIGAQGGLVYLWEIPCFPDDLSKKIDFVDHEGRFTILLRNDGNANIVGLKIILYAEKAGVPVKREWLRIPEPFSKVIVDDTNRHIWTSNSELTSLAVNQRIGISMHVLDCNDVPENFTLVVELFGDNQKKSRRERFELRNVRQAPPVISA